VTTRPRGAFYDAVFGALGVNVWIKEDRIRYGEAGAGRDVRVDRRGGQPHRWAATLGFVRARAPPTSTPFTRPG